MPNPTPPSDHEVASLLSRLDQGRTELLCAAKNLPIENAEGKAEPNPGLARMGWAEHLAGRDPEMLQLAISTDAD